MRSCPIRSKRECSATSNANDGTSECIDYPELNAFTVQFHPEACGGPLDANFLFDEFIARMGKEC